MPAMVLDGLTAQAQINNVQLSEFEGHNSWYICTLFCCWARAYGAPRRFAFCILPATTTREDQERSGVEAWPRRNR